MREKIPTEVLPTHTPQLFQDAVGRAAELLQAGEVVALPTETVYGLAANALDSKAVKRIYAVKDRPAVNPVIVHVAGLEMAKRCVTSWPALAEKLARAFWPGPLTLVQNGLGGAVSILANTGPHAVMWWSLADSAVFQVRDNESTSRNSR